jgi:hypothetical protein
VKRDSLRQPFFCREDSVSWFSTAYGGRAGRLDAAIIDDKMHTSSGKSNSTKIIFKSKLNFVLVKIMKRKTNKPIFDQTKIICKSKLNFWMVERSEKRKWSKEVEGTDPVLRGWWGIEICLIPPTLS